MCKKYVYIPIHVYTCFSPVGFPLLPRKAESAFGFYTRERCYTYTWYMHKCIYT